MDKSQIKNSLLTIALGFGFSSIALAITQKGVDPQVIETPPAFVVQDAEGVPPPLAYIAKGVNSDIVATPPASKLTPSTMPFVYINKQKS
ncbi:MAG: hypothetical protein ACI8WB_003535 [Phenylobacterium sp.]|jgi:hypothetical protein